MLVIPYDTVEEAIAIANGSRYGLGASVFGPEQHYCLAVARQLECGMVSVNDFAVYYLNQDLPFGGLKGSGYGRFGGPEGLRGLCNAKAIVVDKFPWLIQTSIPKALDYPVRSLVQSWYVPQFSSTRTPLTLPSFLFPREFVSGLIALVYADKWVDRFWGLVKLIQSS